MAKKKIAARIYDRIFGSGGQKPAKRMYAAARFNRQNADWSTHVTSANWEMRTSLRQLRARARQAARDNSHFKKYLSLVRSNIIGPKGMKLKSNARRMDQSLDVELNKMVEEQFWLWGQSETCTVSGKLDWLAVQRLIVTQLARDGEFLVRMVPAANDFGFSLKVINVDYLDETFTQIAADTRNRIIMSVEIDPDDKPVAYWLTTPAADIAFAVRQERHRIRVDASEIIHGFLTFDDEAQVRGVTWFHAAMLDAKNFQGYREGVIQSARVTANSLGFFTRNTPDGEDQFTGEEDPLTGIINAANMDFSPMSFNVLPDDYDVKMVDPKQPTQNHPGFTKTIEMTLATGLDLPYFELSGDMEAVNYSSARVGLDSSREVWKGLQDFVATVFCRPVFHAWARSAFLSGALKMTARDFAAIQNPEWKGRSWKYIDPVKDVGADISALENNLTTFTDVLAEKGVDLVDFLEKRKAELELAKQYGIDLVAVTSVKVAENTPPADTPPPANPKRSYLNGESHDDDEMVN